MATASRRRADLRSAGVAADADVRSGAPRPAAVPDLLRYAGNRAVANVAAAPERMPFPHGATISSALGMALPGTAVHDAAACTAHRVPAFTDGLVSHFASPAPGLRVAAHEATHQLQHAGRTNDQGVGPEAHAHTVATTIAAGRRAPHLLGSAGAAVVRARRHFTTVSEAEQQALGQWQVGGNARVSDDGRTVVTDADAHLCYADAALIERSNAILEAKRSGIRLGAGSEQISGAAPDGSGVRQVVKVDYLILTDEDNLEFYADCGRSAREVQGPTTTDTSPRGIYTDAAGDRQETSRSKNPATYRDEIYVAGGLGPDRASAYAAYQALSPADKDAFDQRHGINRYAAPGVGEAFTRRRDDAAGGTGFNFHWGGVVMVTGGDRVTFENYTKGKGYDAKDIRWYFAMYGPPTKPGQTWHEQWVSVGGAGKGTTIAAATSDDPSPYIAAAAARTTAALIAALDASAIEGEKMALDAELRRRWIRVTVDVRKAQEGTDEVYVVAEHDGREYETGAIDLASGARNTFWIPVKTLMPIDGKILVEVYDADVFSDDMISIIGFDAPYAPSHDNRPWDDAEYHTTVEFDR